MRSIILSLCLIFSVHMSLSAVESFLTIKAKPNTKLSIKIAQRSPGSLRVDWGDGKWQMIANVSILSTGAGATELNGVVGESGIMTISGGDINYFVCTDQEITELDVSNCTTMRYLNCSRNKLENIKVSSTKSLVYVNISSNKLNANMLNSISNNLADRRKMAVGTYILKNNPANPEIDEVKNKNWKVEK